MDKKGRSEIVSVCWWHDLTYGKPKGSTQKNNKWIQKVPGYKIYIQRSVTFRCTKNELSEK